MGKAVYVCARNYHDIASIKVKVARAIRKLVPDNIPDAPCKVVVKGTIVYGIANFSNCIAEHEGSVCMGIAYPELKAWWQPQELYPDGSFAIIRCNENYIEAITDTTASRTIWYYKDESVFVCGTSQRAIITVLEKFDFDKRVIPWVLSTGSLGPSFSWCKNLSRLEPNTSLLLDRKQWQLRTKHEPVIFKATSRRRREHPEKLKEALVNSFKNYQPDLSLWVLPLSGGYDSRAVAGLLKASGKKLSQLEAVTWGLKESLTRVNNDAYVAGLVAKEFGMPHKYLETDNAIETPEVIFKRFILNGEGRIDRIDGYTDGFSIWKTFFDDGKLGIIRGDEGFGWAKVTSARRVRYMCGLTLCTDYSNLENYKSYGLETQELPGFLQQRKGETTQMLIDRYYIEFRIPTIMSALNDLKLSYVEVSSPLLTRKILMTMRSLPDRFRIDRYAFREAMKGMVPATRYATEDATGFIENIFGSPDAVGLMVRELSEAYMQELFPAAFVKKVLEKLQQTGKEKKPGGFKSKLRRVIKLYVPSRLKETMYTMMGKPALDNSVLAFRIYMTGKMYKQLMEDSMQGGD